MMNPAKIAKPPASTPNTPDARSPSLKRLPAGARRRRSSIAAIAAVFATTMTTMPRSRRTRPVILGERRRRGIVRSG